MISRSVRAAFFAAAFVYIAIALSLVASAAAAPVGNEAQPAIAPDSSPIFDPSKAPVIVIHIGARLIVLVPRNTGSQTQLGATTIDRQSNGQGLTAIIAQNVAGAAKAPSGEIHIRGSHGQYSYYLDGVPLPTNVTGSFTDLINPKDIQTLKVYTGGFPPLYGGQLAAVFDITAKAGAASGGMLQQLAQGYDTYQTTAQYGSRDKDFSYFLSAVDASTHFQLSPVTETPLHDDGNSQVGFGKFDYVAGPKDRITLDSGITGAVLQVPNDPNEQSFGVNDNQKEDTAFNNLIWTHSTGPGFLRTAFYEHTSQFRFIGDPAADEASDQNSTTTENELAQYLGFRTDWQTAPIKENRVQTGIDLNSLSGHQDFNSVDLSQPPGQQIITADNKVTGGDKSAYLQDDWTPGRFTIDYGARYDIYTEPGLIASQLSPRVNVSYNAGRDTFHIDYDRLFQPVPAENVINLSTVANAILPVQPERDDFFESGWSRTQGGATLSVDAYYRSEINTVDDQTYGATQIDIPVNFKKGYARGVEFSLDGPLSKSTSYYVNYARSWAQGAGPIVGGLFGAGSVPIGYFFVDHDQTETSSFGLSYKRGDTYADLDGEYGSGFPYGQRGNGGTPTAINYLFTDPHTTFDLDFGTRAWKTRWGTGQIGFLVDNVLNHAYIIKYAGAFSGTQWAPGRAYGIKLTQNF